MLAKHSNFGAHLFYYKKYIRAFLYLCFFWTFIPMVLGWIDLFFIKRWTEEINNKKLEQTKSQNSRDLHNDEVEQDWRIEQKEGEIAKQDSIKSGKTRSQKVDALLKNAFVFYNEKGIILPKYSNLKTSQDVLESINEAKSPDKNKFEQGGISFEVTFGSPHKDFFEQSLKHAQIRGFETKEIPFKSYWPTYEHLNNRQLKWYFYWREQALNQNYIDIDLSYIFIFVYELLNYSFNKNASFNVSMMVSLLKNYEERLPKLKGYLTTWIADMLYELDETELANEWESHHENVPRLYELLQDKSDSLERLSISVWKPYVRNHRETDFFKENKSKIYKKFKQSVPILQEKMKQDGKKLVQEWFHVRENRVVRHLYRGAVMGRRSGEAHAYVTEYAPTKALPQVVTNLYRLSENVVRFENGVKREIKVDETILPDGMKEEMLKMNERFKTVRVKEKGTKGSTIPKAPEQAKETRDIEFDWEEIGQKEKELERLQGEIEAKEQDEPKNESLVSPDPRKEEIINNEYDSTNDKEDEEQKPPLDAVFTEGDEDFEEFVSSLTDVEKEFILLFEGCSVSVEKAKAFVKTQGMMLGVYLTVLNEKANEHLEDVMFEESGEVVEIVEDFEEIIVMVRSAIVEN